MNHIHHQTQAVASSVQANYEQVVRVTLEAAAIPWRYAPGHVVTGYGLNGQIPGPVIEAEQGIPLEIQLKNNLPEATVIHWHGLRIPAAMDGTEHVQPLVQPGETFTYRFTPPDAGTFWYHSHANETVQLERGLYGALIVRGKDEPNLDGEQVLVLDDLKVDRKGQIAPFGGLGGLMDRHNGREGNVRLVNGQSEPELTIAAGQIERWRIINASSARYVRLSIGGVPFQILGTGGGLLGAPVQATDYLLATADRVDIAVGPFQEGEVLTVEALPYNRGTGLREPERFATLKVGPAKPSTASFPERLRTIEPLVTGPVTPNRTVKLSGRMSIRRGFDFMVNDEMHHHAEPVKVGELQVWDIVNVAPIDHPFHLHGFFFQVLSVNGQPPAWRSWEDVVNVPGKSTVRIAWLPDNRPGSWMYHCHILEHHAAGMMAHFEVVR
jgi:FtsP/CotA-like multicopper oxidase with cupredoxin domain